MKRKAAKGTTRKHAGSSKHGGRRKLVVAHQPSHPKPRRLVR